MNKTAFQSTLWEYYRAHGRDLPWRQPEQTGVFDPYKILVSEIMLQQTQVQRVIPKYIQFLEMFPTVQSLATASLATVLEVWLGLGYNRRAKFLWHTARIISDEYAGSVPSDIRELVKLPGIGTNTAAAILVYAYNQPHNFIETNIRSVYIHHFFHGRESVTDTELMPIIEQTLDKESPRHWYWALMDYGGFLKSRHSNPSRQSKHHIVQADFAGSRRQLRGKLLGFLRQPRTLEELEREISDPRLLSTLDDLCSEGLISSQGDQYTLG